MRLANVSFHIYMLDVIPNGSKSLFLMYGFSVDLNYKQMIRESSLADEVTSRETISDWYSYDPRGQATNLAMSDKCSIGIRDLGKTMLEISFVGKNKPLEKRTQSLPRGEVFIYSGNAPGTNAWLVVLKRLE